MSTFQTSGIWLPYSNPGQVVVATNTGWQSGQISASGIANGAIGSAQIANGAVGQAQLAAGSVGAAQIQNNAVGAAQIAAGAVGSSQLANGAVGQSQLANGAVGQAQLANGSVGSAQLIPGSVDSTILAPNAVQTSNIAAAAVTPAQIAPGSNGQVLETVGSSVAWVTPAVAPNTITVVNHDGTVNPYPLTTGESGTLQTNAGSSGALTITLPTPSTGLYYTFSVLANQLFTVQTQDGSNSIGSSDGGTAHNASSMFFNGNAPGFQFATLALICYGPGGWVVSSNQGGWQAVSS